LLLRREFFRVTDHFAVLGVHRSPWVDAEALKERFHRLSAQHHPDAAGGSAQAFTDLNAAWQTLRDPAKCLRHYLELTHPASLDTAGRTPPGLADLFMDIAAFRQDAQRLTSRLASTSTPLARAILEPERLALRSRVDTLAGTVTARIEELQARLRNEAPPPEQLAEVLASMVFLDKWATQLSEARLAL
jgi:hypothetical protein